ncbi:MAG: CpaF family protein [Acidimicrobiia bacterium]|nr:MAG: CpaF family protein [Acidimicrobiia bacterium]
MTLSDRLRQAQKTSADNSLASDRPKEAVLDPFSELKQRAQRALLDRLGSKLADQDISEGQLKQVVVKELDEILASEQIPLSLEERRRLTDEVTVDFLGYGPIQQFLLDDSVTEVMVNATDAIYIERAGRLERTDVRFATDAHVRRIIEKIVSRIGRRIDESSPMVDARLPDGSRVNAVVPPLAVDGPTITIRKFTKEAFTVDDLLDFGSLTPEVAEFLRIAVEGKRNILISGGTGSGKTTMLNVLTAFIPEAERIVTIEDAVELQLNQEHVVRLESRPPNIEGKGEVTIRDLVRNSLRMRPDRIIVGEVRSGEALDMMQAMNTGHEGSLSTIHSNSPRDALSRLETMVLMSGVELGVRAIREQIGSSIDLLIQIDRFRDGSRGISQVTEITGMEGDVVTMQDIYKFRFQRTDDRLGILEPTGIRPMFSEQLREEGFEMDAALFSMPGRSR